METDSVRNYGFEGRCKLNHVVTPDRTERTPADCIAQASNRLVSCDSVKSGINTDTAYGACTLERSILLDRKDANRSILRIQCVEKFPISADSDVKICSSFDVCPYHCSGKRRQSSICSDCKSSDG